MRSSTLTLPLLLFSTMLGCASYDYTQDCFSKEGSDEWNVCVEEVKERRNQEVAERYLICRKAAEIQGHVWVQISRGPTRRDRKTGMPRSRQDQSLEIMENGCRL